MSATPVAERAHEDGAAADAASAVASTAVAKRACEGDLAGGAAADAASAVTSTAVAKRSHDDAMAGGASADAAPKRQCRRDKVVRVSRMAMSGVTGIFSVLASDDGELFVGTKSALYLKSPAGRVTLIAGHPSECGFKDGQSTEARFNTITGLALICNGGVVLVDRNNHSVRLVTPSGKCTTVAGNGKAGFADGHGDQARFDCPYGIVVDSNGIAFVTDSFNHCIRLLSPYSSSDWYAMTVCGKGRENGSVNGPAEDARFDKPLGLALNMQEDLIVADSGNNSLRKVAVPMAPSIARVTTVAGPPDDTALQFADSRPVRVAVDGKNTILVSDTDGRIFHMSEQDGIVLKLEKEGYSDFFCAAFCGICIDKKGRVIFCDEEPGYPLAVAYAGLLSPFTRTTSKGVSRSLQDDYGALLADQSLMDVTFAVDGGVFRAHRAILGARSLVFKQLFQANATTNAHIAITDIPGPVFEFVLRYVYTGEYRPMTAYAEDVSVLGVACAAKKLDVQGLYQDCLEEFKEMFSVDTVIGDLIEAHKNGLSDFEDAAIVFIKDNARCFCKEELDHMQEESLSAFEEHPDLLGVLLRVTRVLVRHIA